MSVFRLLPVIIILSSQVGLGDVYGSDPDRCSANIKIQEDGKFLIEGDEKYNPRYSRVSGVDNDGHISIMSLNAVIDSHFKSRNGDKPYIFTKDDERLIKKASERMKSYFGGAFGIDTSGSYEDILKRATQDFFKKFVQKAIVDYDLELGEDEINGEVNRLLNIFKSNVESFESAEKLIAKGKVLKPEDNVLKSGLSSVFGIHFYDLKNEAVDSTLCKRDYPEASLCGHEFEPRSCAFQQKNILSQTLCGRVEIKGTDKENLMHTISSDLVCSLSIESGIRTKIGDDFSPSGVKNE